MAGSAGLGNGGWGPRSGWLARSTLRALLNSGMGAPFAHPPKLNSNSTAPHHTPQLNHLRPLFPSPHPSQRWTHWHMGSQRFPCPAESSFFIGLLDPLRHIGSQTSIQRRTLDLPWPSSIGRSPRLHNRSPEHEPEEGGSPGRTAPAGWRRTTPRSSLDSGFIMKGTNDLIVALPFWPIARTRTLSRWESSTLEHGKPPTLRTPFQQVSITAGAFTPSPTISTSADTPDHEVFQIPRSALTGSRIESTPTE